MDCWLLQPHATTPRNKDRFLGAPVKRGANNHCAYGADEGLLSLRRPYGTPDGLLVAPTPRYHPKKQRPFLWDPGEARG
jgi:hypothetical protein